MSKETRKNLEEAMEAHIASEHEDPSIILTGYIIQAAGSGINDSRQCLTFNTKEGQGGVVTLGLAAYMQYSVEQSSFEDMDYHEQNDEDE